ncbi:MAG: hypothetical protein NBV67_16530 [Tagaea sp.]|nr:hypothetical protein [Tagaea sp.]
MNREWMALAVATILAIAALLWDFLGRPAAPFLAATELWPSSLCDRPPNAARGAGLAVPGYRLYFEGMSRLVGGCHPADPAAGVAAIERAFAQGLPAAFAISFVDALIAQGRRDDAARWINQAAIVAIDWRALGFDAYGVPLPATSELHAEIARLREVFARANSAELERELSVALSRAKLPINEYFSLEQALVDRLFAVDPGAAYYWTYLAQRRNGTERDSLGLLGSPLFIAASCGFLPAIREQAQLHAAGKLEDLESGFFYVALLLARDAKKDVDELLRAVDSDLVASMEHFDDPEYLEPVGASTRASCARFFSREFGGPFIRR